MKKPVQALLWELWRTSRTELLFRIGVTSASTMLLVRAARPILNGPESQVLAGMAVLILMSIAAASQSWILQFDRSQSGFSFRSNFVRPVSTCMLVALPLAYTVISSAICYLWPALLFRGLTGIDFPLVGPLALVCCAVACFVAASWSPKTLLGRVAAVILVITTMVTLAVSALRDLDEPWITAIGRTETFQFRWYDFAALLLTAGAAMAVTVVSVERQRHGDSWLSDRWLRMWRFGRRAEAQETVLASRAVSEGRRLFASPAAAQYWYEFRRFGQRTLWISLLAPAAVAAFITAGLVLGYDPRGANRVWMLALLICPVAYQIIGIDGAVGLRQVRGALLFPVFDATRPMSSEHLIRIKLIVVAIGSLVGWLCMAIAAGACVLLLGDVDYWLQAVGAAAKLLEHAPIWLWLLGFSGLVLSLTSTTSLVLAIWLWMPFHPKICAGLGIAVLGHIPLVVWDSDHGWELLPLWQFYGYSIPVLIVGICLTALRRAHSTGILHTRLFAISAAAWLVYTSTAVFALLTAPSPPPITIPGQVFAAAGAMIFASLAAVAAAPLALDEHRHGQHMRARPTSFPPR